MAPATGKPRTITRKSGNTHDPSRRALLVGASALATAGALGAAGCSRVASASGVAGGELLDRLRAQGVVRLGIAGEIPFGYINTDGELTGEGPEVARVVFRRLGVDRVQPVPTEFGSLIPGLNSQQFDVVSAGMYINPERCAEVVFSEPDHQMLDAFVVRKGNPKGLNDYADVIRARARFATGSGYAQIAHAVEAGYPENDIVIVPDQVAGLNAVEAGRVDLFAGTSLTTRDVVKKSRRAEATKPFAALVDGKPRVDGAGFAFRPAETRLRDAFNVELRKMKESGELLRVLRPFGFTKVEMTDLTTKELCRA